MEAWARALARVVLVEATYGQINNPHSFEGNALLSDAGRIYDTGLRVLDKGHAEKAWGLLGEAIQKALEAGTFFE